MVGLVAAILIKKIVGKIIALVLAAALIFFGWQQRQHVIDFANGVKGEACCGVHHVLRRRRLHARGRGVAA